MRIVSPHMADYHKEFAKKVETADIYLTKALTKGSVLASSIKLNTEILRQRNKYTYPVPPDCLHLLRLLRSRSQRQTHAVPPL